MLKIKKNNEQGSVTLWFAMTVPIFVILFFFMYLQINMMAANNRYIENVCELAADAAAAEVDIATLSTIPVGYDEPFPQIDTTEARKVAQEYLMDNFEHNKGIFKYDLEETVYVDDLPLDEETLQPIFSDRNGVAVKILNNTSYINPKTGEPIEEASVLIVIQTVIKNFMNEKTITKSVIKPISFALLEAERFDVIYDANGGINPPTTQSELLKYTIKNFNTDTPIMTRENHTFVRWSDTIDGFGNPYIPNDEIVPTQDITLYAVWEENKTLTYNANGGINPPDASNDNIEYFVKNSESMSKGNSTFIGWSLEQDGSGEIIYPGSLLRLTEDTTLYAIWDTTTYTISYDLNGGTGTVPEEQSGSTNYTTPSSAGIIAPSTMKKFAGWNTLASGNGINYEENTVITPDLDMTLYAKWIDKEFLFFDDFNRADSTTVSGWSSARINSSTYGINANQIVTYSASATSSFAIWKTFSPAKNDNAVISGQFISSTSGTTNDQVRVYMGTSNTVGPQGSGQNGYLVMFYPTARVSIQKITNGVLSVLVNRNHPAPAPTLPYEFAMKKEGNTISAFVNGVLIQSFTDTTSPVLSTPIYGVQAYSTSGSWVRFDNVYIWDSSEYP